MVSRIEPDRDADTGFAMKDTAPETNAMIFAAMMRKTPNAERPTELCQNFHGVAYPG